jgi:hypothetical protein
MKAERTRRSGRPKASKEQRDYIAALSRQVGMVPPRVFWAYQATDAIKRLKAIKARRHQPQLEGFRGAVR